MNTLQQSKNRGFTIIEVVLVLAIAALIMIMVFIALPALQAGQRDTARKNDVSVVAAAYNQAIGNNRGAAVDTAKMQQYVSGTSGNTTSTAVAARPTSAVTPADAVVTVYTKAKCGTINSTDGSITLSAGTATQYATVTKLEGGNKTPYCLDS